jgi:hypothetical protein
MQIKKSRLGLTMLAKIIRAVIMLSVGKKKTRKLEKISRRRNAESLSGLPGMIRLGSDNLIMIVKLIMRFYRLYPSLAAGPRDYAVRKKNVYFRISLSTIILIKILILAFQIFIQRRHRQRLIRI